MDRTRQHARAGTVRVRLDRTKARRGRPETNAPKPEGPSPRIVEARAVAEAAARFLSKTAL